MKLSGVGLSQTRSRSLCSVINHIESLKYFVRTLETFSRYPKISGESAEEKIRSNHVRKKKTFEVILMRVPRRTRD